MGERNGEIIFTRRTSCIEEIARLLPAGKPVHQWPGGFHGFNEYDESRWYYCNALHVIGMMILFVIVSSIYLFINIIYDLSCVSHGTNIFIVSLFAYLFEISLPVICMIIFVKIKPTHCSTLGTLLLVFVVIKICLGIMFLSLFFVAAFGEKLEKNHPFKNFKWDNGGLIFLSLEYFGFAALWFFVRKWNVLFHEYLVEKQLALSNETDSHSPFR